MGKLKSIFQPDPNAIANNLYATVIWAIVILLGGGILAVWASRSVWLEAFQTAVQSTDAPTIAKTIIGFVIPTLGFAVLIWFIGWLLKRAYRIFRPVPKLAVSASPTTLDRFSYHLDECLKELIEKLPQVKITGLGLRFLNAVKNAPPFLGLSYSQWDWVIHPDVEQKLTEYFLATEWVDEHDKYIHGGFHYKVKDGDTIESIAANEYGDEKFATELMKANQGGYPVTTGQNIWLPSMDTKYSEEIPIEYVRGQLAIAQYAWISSTIEVVRSDYSLTVQETLPILLAIYEAAQRTLRGEGRIKSPVNSCAKIVLAHFA